MAAILVYITAATPEDAKSIGAAIVGERLAACANVIPGMTSIYRWKGEMRPDSEAVLEAGPAVWGRDEDQCWTLARIAEVVRAGSA